MKVIKGVPKHVRRPILGKVTRKELPLLVRKDYVFCGADKPNLGYVGSLSQRQPPAFSLNPTPAVYGIPPDQAENLKEGDIVLLNPSGEVAVLWESNSWDNCILVTEQCNCRCIICPQPPRKDPKLLHEINRRVLSLLESGKTERICLTGGEPTLNKKRFLELLKLRATCLPETELMILTNAQTFSDFGFASQVATLASQKTTFCVSLHADTAELHNFITSSEDGFRKTIRGIQNLGKLRQNIEIRFVINKLNFRRLLPFALFIYRNFPFVVHVAFMGLEMTGWALENQHDIWIDPADHREELRQAVWELHRRDLNVSIYNIPLCLLDARSWRFARQSISSWKNDYLPICAECDVMTQCCGIFTTSGFHSPQIAPMKIAGSVNISESISQQVHIA